MKHLVVIKTGQFETFTQDEGESISLGDVLRCTCILRSEIPKITWITSETAGPLLKSSFEAADCKKDLSMILEKDFQLSKLQNDPETRFLNLERSWEIPAVTGKTLGQKIASHLSIPLPISTPLLKNPNVPLRHDIGFNWKVGPKWPMKQVPLENWKKLETLLKLKHTLSWQEGFEDLQQYIRWIASHRLIITSDSLGLHIAIALKIPVIGLFGVTSPDSIDINSHSKLLRFPEDTHCSSSASLSRIVSEVDRLL